LAAAELDRALFFPTHWSLWNQIISDLLECQCDSQVE
jgi:hypothetical protein